MCVLGEECSTHANTLGCTQEPDLGGSYGFSYPDHGSGPHLLLTFEPQVQSSHMGGVVAVPELASNLLQDASN